MSIGKVSEYVSFVKNTDYSTVSFKATKIRFSEDRKSITVLSWGDNLTDWILSMDTYYYMFGLVSIKAKNEYADSERSRFTLDGGGNCSISTLYSVSTSSSKRNLMSYGYGLFMGIDDSDPNYSLYALVSQPVAENGTVVTRDNITLQITDGSWGGGYYLDSTQGFYQYYADTTSPRWKSCFFETNPDFNGKIKPIYGFPYGDGESTSQGGQGDMTDTSDPIDIDSKPLLTTGDFLRVYKLTATDLTALRNKLISDGFLDGLIAKLRTDAMDYIVGLNAIPISATNVLSFYKRRQGWVKFSYRAL